MASQSNMTPGQEEPVSSGVAMNNYQGRELNVLWDRSVSKEYYLHATAPRVSTNTVAARALKAQYPSLELTITFSHVVPLLAFAAAGHAEYTPLADTDVALPALRQKNYHPPARRLDGDQGSVGEATSFGKFHYKWSGHEFIVYLIDCHEGTAAYPSFMNFYILSTSTHLTDQLVLAAGHWADDLHDEVWVFDGGMWQKSRELYYSVRNASWENVILDEDIKKTLIEDHMSFFRSRETYAGLKVPWKRGIIYYGPPGNGKTISIKATMNMLNRNEPRIPTLYVRTLTSYMGPEASVKQIFAKARQFAPCYLVLEDLDTIISDSVRSYFLNEVDGLKNNDGIFMVGSTNHLDRLDPGISKRPSRFDRKYFFSDPDLDQRVAYCQYWQKKLKDNKDIEFPDKICKAVADITDGFSFAYIQEAFVAALLAIARRSDPEAAPGDRSVDGDWVAVSDDDDDDLDKVALWVELKKQIGILREGMDKKSWT